MCVPSFNSSVADVSLPSPLFLSNLCVNKKVLFSNKYSLKNEDMNLYAQRDYSLNSFAPLMFSLFVYGFIFPFFFITEDPLSSNSLVIVLFLS